MRKCSFQSGIFAFQPVIIRVAQGPARPPGNTSRIGLREDGLRALRDLTRALSSATMPFGILLAFFGPIYRLPRRRVLPCGLMASRACLAVHPAQEPVVRRLQPDRRFPPLAGRAEHSPAPKRSRCGSRQSWLHAELLAQFTDEDIDDLQLRLIHAAIKMVKEHLFRQRCAFAEAQTAPASGIPCRSDAPERRIHLDRLWHLD